MNEEELFCRPQAKLFDEWNGKMQALKQVLYNVAMEKEELLQHKTTSPPIGSTAFKLPRLRQMPNVSHARLQPH